MIFTLFAIAVAIGLLIHRGWIAYRRQDEAILKEHVRVRLLYGHGVTDYRCGACKARFREATGYIVTCPNCRGLVRIRLPRG